MRLSPRPLLYERKADSRHAEPFPHHRFCRSRAGRLRTPDRKSAREPRGSLAGAFHRGKPQGHRAGAERGLCARLVPDGAAPCGNAGAGHSRALRRGARLHRAAGRSQAAHRFPAHARDALRHAPPAAAGGRDGLRGRKARRRAGGCDEPHERWRDLSLRGGARHRRRAADAGVQRPALPPRRARWRSTSSRCSRDFPRRKTNFASQIKRRALRRGILRAERFGTG